MEIFALGILLEQISIIDLFSEFFQPHLGQHRSEERQPPCFWTYRRPYDEVQCQIARVNKTYQFYVLWAFVKGAYLKETI
jgi:hypothetical protein